MCLNIYDKQGNMKEVHNPGGMPDPTLIDHIEEPYIKASIITTTDYIGSIMTLCLGKRGELLKQEYISGNRVEIYYNMPLGEIVIDFYDKLKSISKGYASFDYHPNGFRTSKLVKLDILLNGEPVDALSTLIHFDNAYDMGRRMCEKLKELIPRQQFEIAIQAAIGAKIIARETIKAVRKDVTAKCYGGDVSRKRKLLEKQKKGKKRMKQIGNVEVPQKSLPRRTEAGLKNTAASNFSEICSEQIALRLVFNTPGDCFLSAELSLAITFWEQTTINMRKVLSFSGFLMLGLVVSQFLPMMAGDGYGAVKSISNVLLYVCLSFIMINVGREFVLDKTRWKSYAQIIL